MTKTVLAEQIAAQTGVSKKETLKVLDALVNITTDAVKNGKSVQLTRFGTFEMKRRRSREGRDPRNSEKIIIQAANVPVFRPSKVLKRELNQ